VTVLYTVQYAVEFHDRLADIEDYMAFHGRSEASIGRYTTAVYDACDSFCTFPNRGVSHDDVMPGLQITNYQGDTILAFVVDEDDKVVTFLGVFYRGQDWQSAYESSPRGH
jgi:toxin ParE1/3/4